MQPAASCPPMMSPIRRADDCSARSLLLAEHARCPATPHGVRGLIESSDGVGTGHQGEDRSDHGPASSREVTVTAAGWLLPAGSPPRIGVRLRAGQGHCENESGGQNYRERERIADVPTATSTPPMRSCRPTSTKTLGPRRGLRICGDHHLHSPPLRASRRARRTAAAARASGGRASHRVLARPAHHHGPVPQSDRPSGSRLATVPWRRDSIICGRPSANGSGRQLPAQRG